tara:strand:+ start:2924 stop:3265 length:342 start_codon:yes stop_codon:yes gene_type:complete
MKLAKEKLKKIIKEELDEVLQVAKVGTDLDTPVTATERKMDELMTTFTNDMIIDVEEKLSMLANAIVANEEDPESSYLHEAIEAAIADASSQLEDALTRLIKEFDVRDVDQLH